MSGKFPRVELMPDRLPPPATSSSPDVGPSRDTAPSPDTATEPGDVLERTAPLNVETPQPGRRVGPRAVLAGAVWSLGRTWTAAPGWFLAVIFSTVLLALIPALQVRTVAWLVGDAADSTSWPDLIVPLVLLTLLVCLTEVVSSVQNLIGQRAGLRLKRRLDLEIAEVANRRDPAQIADDRMHAILDGVRNDTYHLSQSPGSVIGAVGAVLTAAALAVSLWSFSGLAAVLIVLALVPTLINYGWSATMQDRHFEAMGTHSTRSRYLMEQLVDQRTAQELATLGSGPLVRRRLGRATLEHDRLMDRMLALLMRGDVVGGLITAVLLGAALVCVIGESGGAAGLSAGILGVISGLQTTRAAGYAMGDVLGNAPRIARFRELKEAVPPYETQQIIPVCEELAVQGLTVTYPGADRPALQDASLTVCRGDMVAVVGVNGAGKATLVNAVIGMVTAQHGSVTVDGVDLSTLTAAQRFARFGLLTQEFGRYEMTVRDAVALGSPRESVSDEEVWAALDAAHAGELVRTMPDGLDSMLGQQFGGRGLSGGQWQRVALARIYLRGAGIWILDEPTSAIDAEAERDVFAQLRRTKAERITVVVSHRAWTLRGMDCIYVVDEGHVVESGTYDELMAAQTRFAEIFAQQAD